MQGRWAVGCWLCLAAPFCLPAGVVSGVVLERQSGAALARSRVRLDRVDVAGRVESASLLAGRTGQFTFIGVKPGLYVLTALRDGYAPARFGQPPFEVAEDSNLFTEMRLRKLGAITGRVLDENRVGIARAGVAAYPLSPPFRAAATAESDDRGIYRLHGLKPGTYRVRTTGFRHQDGLSLLPTFAPESLEPRDAKELRVRLDGDVSDVDVTPIPGTLHSVGGRVTCSAPNPNPVDVVLASPTGRRRVRTGCQTLYRIDDLAPGPYEFSASTADGQLAVFYSMRVEHSMLNAHLELRPMGELRLATVEAAGRGGLPLNGMIALRRVDPAGVVEEREVAIKGGTARLILPPGWWEVAGRFESPNLIEWVRRAFRNRSAAPRASCHPDWHEVLVEDHIDQLQIGVSNTAGAAEIRVTEPDGAKHPVPGIPVWLWPVDPGVRRRNGGIRMAFANLEGLVRLEGLTPGEYRVVASFDLEELDADTAEAARGVPVTVEAGSVAAGTVTPFRAVEN